MRYNSPLELRSLAHRAVTEGVNMQYVEQMRRGLYDAADPEGESFERAWAQAQAALLGGLETATTIQVGTEGALSAARREGLGGFGRVCVAGSPVGARPGRVEVGADV